MMTTPERVRNECVCTFTARVMNSQVVSRDITYKPCNVCGTVGRLAQLFLFSHLLGVDWSRLAPLRHALTARTCRAHLHDVPDSSPWVR